MPDASCVICLAILEMIGGQDLRADFKATSLDTLHARWLEMLHQSRFTSAQELHATWNGVGPKDEHEEEEDKTVGDATTSASLAPKDRSSSEMFTDRPCVCPEFNPSPKSEGVNGPHHQFFVESNHSAFSDATGGNMTTDWQQDFDTTTHFKDAIEAIQQGEIGFDPMEVDCVLEMMGLE
ncbi:hypothetical protein LY76DRAFT_608466 [Colletotrichum caudatum]|nr:hypothetical protein LY76DRAFT_608466 [Colletotrichum caudatum]